jgi:RNA polymerase sigma factor (sigma-70 family)
MGLYMAIEHWNDSVLDLIPGYNRSLRLATKARETAPEDEQEIYKGMIADLNYALEWMRHGGNPYRRHGAEKKYARSWDPAWLDHYKSPHGRYTDRTQFTGELSADDRFRIEEAMRELSEREKQCYMLYHVDGMSEYDIAIELQIGRSTVQKFMERATTKIENAKLTSLFLWK